MVMMMMTMRMRMTMKKYDDDGNADDDDDAGDDDDDDGGAADGAEGVCAGDGDGAGVGGGGGDAGCGDADEVDDAPYCAGDGCPGKHTRWCSAHWFLICMINQVIAKHPHQLGSGAAAGRVPLRPAEWILQAAHVMGQQDWRAAAISCIVSST